MSRPGRWRGHDRPTCRHPGPCGERSLSPPYREGQIVGQPKVQVNGASGLDCQRPRVLGAASAAGNPRGADGLQNRTSGGAGCGARGQSDGRPARHDPLAEITHQRLAPRPDSQIPPKSVRRPTEATHVAGMQPFLVMTDAERDQIVFLIVPLLRPEDYVVLVEAAARSAAGGHAAPAVALEDAIAPLPVRVVPVVPGVAHRLDEEEEALPVVE